MNSRRCTAHSSQTGEPCKRSPCVGTTVCASHGGRSPQVRAAAAERLQALVHPAIDRLALLLADESASIGLATARDILDRAGLSGRTRIEVETTVANTLAAELGIPAEALLAEAARLAANGHHR